jgi:glycosyltransferase involved in cell wall biosynthesis
MVTIHGLEYRWLPEYRNLLQRWYLPLSTIYAARSATRLLAVSEHTREEIVRELRVEPSKIAVVPEGVSLENSGYSGGDLGRHGLRKGRYILFIGSLQPRKNLPALVEAFALFGRARSDWKLVIAGGKGWMTEEVFSAPARAGVQERVVFTGRVSEREKLSLLTNAAMYVQPSLTEGFGLPLLEAMAQGTPVIASDGGALPETAGKAAIVVKLGKGFEKRLAKAMERIADEPKLKSQLAAAGMARAREQSWKKVAEESWQELRNLTN